MSIIEVSNLGKEYYIGERQKYLALRDILTNIARAPFSWFKDKVVGNKGEGFWALKDVNFKVEQGEVLGIIGRNGAGKSTLLKILSRITPPTTGEIRINGRVGSLLEVGTGFHPELTGRENVYLNGAILGMRKKEIERKFDEIVDFAGITKFLDTPVKHYSSGMYVRLAFSVAAHLEPEILIVDEVLAVGDAEFQKRCLGKMEDVTKKEGRTVLFVSHNMGAVRNLCNRCILLDGGEIKMIGPTNEVVAAYLSNSSSFSSVEVLPRHHIRGNKFAQINKILVTNQENHPADSFLINEPLKFVIDYSVADASKDLSFWIIFFDNDGNPLISSFQKDFGALLKSTVGNHKLEVNFKDLGLLTGAYTVTFGIFTHDGLTKWDFADWVGQCLTINISSAFADGKVYDGRWGRVDKKADWNVIN